MVKGVYRKTSLKGITLDALIMNVEDLLCMGATDNILVSSTTGRNKNNIPGKVIAVIINGTKELLSNLLEMRISIYSTGGETADVGDLVRTIIVDSTVTCRMKKADVVSADNISAGNVIVGLSSSGKASYESEYNGGMGSNGLTSVRHDFFAKYHAKIYPGSFDPAVPTDLVYSGAKKLTDKIEALGIDTKKYVVVQFCKKILLKYSSFNNRYSKHPALWLSVKFAKYGDAPADRLPDLVFVEPQRFLLLHLHYTFCNTPG